MNKSISIALTTLVTITSLLISACTRPITNTEGKTTSKAGKINMPSACLDPKRQFMPIKSITTKLGYNDKPSFYKPIRNEQGFITHDFNSDKKNDYVFIERNQKVIKLATCISRNDNYQRKQTPFTVHEEKQADFQTISESIKLQNNYLHLSINKHEHNWGSDNETNTYRFDINRNDFILVKQTIFSSSGDGMRSDTEAYYDLSSQRYQQKQTCGFAEEGCTSRKPQIIKGRIILPKNKASLYKGGKIYERLMAD